MHNGKSHHGNHTHFFLLPLAPAIAISGPVLPLQVRLVAEPHMGRESFGDRVRDHGSRTGRKETVQVLAESGSTTAAESPSQNRTPSLPQQQNREKVYHSSRETIVW